MSPTPHHERTARTREALRRAAVDAFAERGFHGTSIRDLAQLSGLSSAALYSHYATKEALLHALAREGHELALAAVRSVRTTADVTPAERLRDAVRAYVLFHATRSRLARVINYELAALSPEHRAEIQALRRQIHQEFLTLVRAGVTSGDFTVEDPEMTAVLMESLGIDVARWFDPDRTWGADTVADRYAAMALRLVRAPGPRAEAAPVEA